MNRWLQSPDSTMKHAIILNREISSQLQILYTNKIAPIQEDFLFSEFYPERVSLGISNIRPIVVVVSEDAKSGSTVSTLLIDQVVEDRHSMSVITNGDISESGMGSILSQVDAELLPRIRVSGCKSAALAEQLTLVHMCMPSTRNPLVDNADLILLTFDGSQPDISEKYRRFISSLKGLISRVRLLIIQPTTGGDSSMLLPLVWTLSKLINAPEMPSTYFIPSDESDTDNATLFTELLSLPRRSILRRIVTLQQTAKLARAHAVLMSHLKSQLPTFNRQAKQERLIADIESIIPVIASKYGIPKQEFPPVHLIKERLETFDFNRIKKPKEGNLNLVADFIEKDVNKILSCIPHTADDLLSTNILPSRPGTPPMVSDRLLRPPNMNDYMTDFAAMNPDKGVIGGSSVRDHLTALSKLPSGTLYKIWKLADLDQDGKLSLKEYAICRELIGLVIAGESLPSILPPSFIL